jgi:hypothetical protein
MGSTHYYAKLSKKVQKKKPMALLFIYTEKFLGNTEKSMSFY